MSIGVIGLGYVGLPLVVAFAEAGESVVAVDVDDRKVAAIAAGNSYIEDIELREAGRRACRESRPRRSYAALAQCEAVLICVPTPLTANREPDLAPLLSAAEALGLGRAARAAYRAGIDNLPRDNARAARTTLGASRRPESRHRSSRRLLTRAGRSWPDRLHTTQHAQGDWRDHAGEH